MKQHDSLLLNNTKCQQVTDSDQDSAPRMSCQLACRLKLIKSVHDLGLDAGFKRSLTRSLTDAGLHKIN